MRKHILTAIGLLAITYPAQAQNVIPPEEYDHPFPGVVKLTRSSSQEEIKSKCPASIFPYHLGCGGKRADGSCAILMADDDTIKKHGWSVDIVFRVTVTVGAWIIREPVPRLPPQNPPRPYHNPCSLPRRQVLRAAYHRQRGPDYSAQATSSSFAHAFQASQLF